MESDATMKRILALVPNWLGDAVMCTPALRALHKRYPHARLTVAGRSAICALLEDLPWIHSLHPIPDRPALSEMLRLARLLREPGCDATVVFPHSFRAALLARLTRSRRRIGYRRNGRRWLLTDSRPPHCEEGRIVPQYMAREYLDLVALLDCPDDNQGLELGLSQAAIQETAPYLEGEGPLIGLAPGAAFGPSKRWMPEAFAAVANSLAKRGPARFVLMTSPSEQSIRETVLAHAEAPLIELPAAMSSVAALKALIARLDLLLCNDSGPRHIANAFKRPVVCIMGPTSPRYTDGPYEIGRVLQRDLRCIPCQQPECPLGHHACMRAISPEQVFEAVMACLTAPTLAKVSWKRIALP